MKIGVAGYTGRVGQFIVKELSEGTWPGLTLAGGSTRKDNTHALFPVYTSCKELLSASDCVIDFTTPESTLSLLEAAQGTGKALVVGTTGLSEDRDRALAQTSRTCPVVQAANMSVGVNLLLAMVEQAAAKLNEDWDIEVFESHHKKKIDAPSGTALALGKAAQNARGGGEFSIDRYGKRTKGDIGYAVSRGGDVVGEHMVTFYGMGERLELGHKATDRALFVRGALRAAQWLDGKPAGLYSMRDVLGL